MVKNHEAQRDVEKITIALIGYPNCGKTTLFNKLIGASKSVGNWSGVTVDQARGVVQLNDSVLEIVDLPGIYSLYDSDSALDAKITREHLFNAPSQLILNVLDINDLERQLFLTIQLIEMGLPLILLLNMQDIGIRHGIAVDVRKLSKLLNIPVLTMVARDGIGLEQLKETILKQTAPSAIKEVGCKVGDMGDSTAIELYKKSNNLIQKIYDENIQERIFELGGMFHVEQVNKRWRALSLLEDVDFQNTKPHDKLLAQFDYYESTAVIPNISLEIATQRHNFARELSQEVISDHKKQTNYIQNALDKILLSKLLGLPVFFILMYCMFTFSIVVGESLQGIFEQLGEKILVNIPNLILDWLGTAFFIKFFLIEGVARGIVTVIAFIPVIGGLYLFLSFLEESGYMSRAAFIIENFMYRLGLPGKAFFPLLIGFGCNVPAIMASRILENHKDRIIVAMITPFMSCGARLSIYALFCSAFFVHSSASVVFGLYMVGIIVGLATGVITRKILAHKTNPLMIMDLPKYQLPNPFSIIKKTASRVADFAFGAGKWIVIVYVLFTALNSITTDFKFITDNKAPAAISSPHRSILQATGSYIHPLFIPIGVKEENWQASVALVTGIFAKEVVVGAFYALYGIDETETNLTFIKQKLLIGFKTNMAVFAYLVFILLYFPCISVFGVIASEFGVKWAVFSAVWSTVIAYVTAYAIYNASNLL